MQVRTRKKILVATVSFFVAAGAVIGYQEIFTKGLERLPAKLCSGAVDRDVAAAALPAAGTAEERGKLTRSSASGQFTFSCFVRTNGSTVSGEAQSSFATAESWWQASEPEQREGAVSVSTGDVTAIALPTLATVYVPCAPPQPKDDRPRSRSLIVEARTIGETRAEGAALRQLVVDFAYQLARHAYQVGDCKKPREFVDELPRITSD